MAERIANPAAIEELEQDVSSLNSKLIDNQYSTSGLATSKCTIQAGGYHKLGKLVVVNIRVMATASNSCNVTGFPMYSSQFNSNIVSCSIVNIGDSLLVNSPCFIRRDGSMTFNGENGKTYAISTVYMCD